VILETWIVIVIECGDRKAVTTTKLKLEALVRNQGGHRRKGLGSVKVWTWCQSPARLGHGGMDGDSMGQDWDEIESWKLWIYASVAIKCSKSQDRDRPLSPDR
jgi:hypothetical protein